MSNLYATEYNGKNCLQSTSRKGLEKWFYVFFCVHVNEFSFQVFLMQKLVLLA